LQGAGAKELAAIRLNAPNHLLFATSHRLRCNRRLKLMPIPNLDTTGFLPVGVFDCTLLEVRLRFGTFQGSDRRPRLFSRLEELVGSMGASGLFEMLLLDGSFVSAIATPNDIDLIAVLPPDHNFERDLSMSDYALVSRTMLKRRFGFDVVLARRDSSLYRAYVEFFSRVREAPHLRKGLLRLRL
jgi:uncharacterized protein DUF6932